MGEAEKSPLRVRFDPRFKSAGEEVGRPHDEAARPLEVAEGDGLLRVDHVREVDFCSSRMRLISARSTRARPFRRMAPWRRSFRWPSRRVIFSSCWRKSRRAIRLPLPSEASLPARPSKKDSSPRPNAGLAGRSRSVATDLPPQNRSRPNERIFGITSVWTTPEGEG